MLISPPFSPFPVSFVTLSLFFLPSCLPPLNPYVRFGTLGGLCSDPAVFASCSRRGADLCDFRSMGLSAESPRPRSPLVRACKLRAARGLPSSAESSRGSDHPTRRDVCPRVALVRWGGTPFRLGRCRIVCAFGCVPVRVCLRVTERWFVGYGGRSCLLYMTNPV